MKILISTVNFNTSMMTNAMISSVKKHVKSIEYSFIVLDNSTTEKFTTCFNDVKIIDNFKQLNIPVSNKTSGDFSHSTMINYLLSNVSCDYMILLDSDVLVFHDFDFISDMNEYISACTISNFTYDNNSYKRTLPFIQCFNINYMRRNQVKFFDNTGFTGQYFYETCYKNNYPIKEINYQNYIIHLGQSSREWNHRIPKFLKKYKRLWKIRSSHKLNRISLI